MNPPPLAKPTEFDHSSIRTVLSFWIVMAQKVFCSICAKLYTMQSISLAHALPFWNEIPLHALSKSPDSQ